VDQKTTYQMAAAVAEALPETHREMFALLLDEVTQPAAEYRRIRRAVGVRRWLRDAGWVKR
jgi:uncharacterized protein YutE (UPF0331/DUF86 family)